MTWLLLAKKEKSLELACLCFYLLNHKFSLPQTLAITPIKQSEANVMWNKKPKYKWRIFRPNKSGKCYAKLGLERKFRDSEHLVNFKFHVLTISSFSLSNEKKKNWKKKCEKNICSTFLISDTQWIHFHSDEKLTLTWRHGTQFMLVFFLPKNICICSAFVGAHSVPSLPFSHIKLELKCFFFFVFHLFLLWLLTRFNNAI